MVDVGGVPYLIPRVDRTRLYAFDEVAAAAGLPAGFLLGAGAASFVEMGRNAELMATVHLGASMNTSQVALIDGPNDGCVLRNYEVNRFALLLNGLLCDGHEGPVIEVVARQRIGPHESLPVCLRDGLRRHYGAEKPIGLGGVFRVEAGRIRMHVMPDFSEAPLETAAAVDQWLRFFDFAAPFTILSVCVTDDMGLHLRSEHSHGYSHEQRLGGHYHGDTTAETVAYRGYFVAAESMWRIDSPAWIRSIGRE